MLAACARACCSGVWGIRLWEKKVKLEIVNPSFYFWQVANHKYCGWTYMLNIHFPSFWNRSRGMEYMVVRLGEWWKTGPCKPRHWKWYMVNYISSTIFGSHIITYDLWNYSPTKSLSRTLQQKKDHEPYVMVETPLKKTSPQIMFSIKILEIAFSHKQQNHVGRWTLGGSLAVVAQHAWSKSASKCRTLAADANGHGRWLVGGCWCGCRVSESSNGKEQSHWNVL